MYKINTPTNTSLKINTSEQGETIEQKVQRITNNKEPITDGAPAIYTDRKDGVKPEYNIKTDRFEIAIDTIDKAAKTHITKRTEAPLPKPAEPIAVPDGGPKPAQATS